MSETATVDSVTKIDHKISKNRKPFKSGRHEELKPNKKGQEKSYSDHSMTISPKNKHQNTHTGKHKYKKRRHGDVAQKAEEMKRLWETARRHDISEEERLKLCLQLHRLVDGNADKLIFAHDTTRVIQTLWRYGGDDTRTKLFAELSPRLVELASSKYAKFYVRKVILYGSKTQKSSVIERLLADAPRLLAHVEASEIVELAFRECHSAAIQRRFVHQFYGPAFQLFAGSSASASLKTAVTRDELPTEQLRPILDFLEARLLSLTNKSVVRHSLAHRVLVEFVDACELLEQQSSTLSEQKLQWNARRLELLHSLQAHLLALVHTRAGARLALLVVWHASPKEQRAMLRSTKSFVMRLVTDPCAHRVLIALVDAVADASLISKILLPELSSHMSELVLDANARAVLQYLLDPRNPLCVPADLRTLLEDGAQIIKANSCSHAVDSTQGASDNEDFMDTHDDDNDHGSSKHELLLARISQPLLDALRDALADIRTQPAALVFMRVALKFARGEKRSLMSALVDLLNEPFICEPSSAPNTELSVAGRRQSAKRSKSHSSKPPGTSNKKSKGLVVDTMLAARDRSQKKRRALDSKVASNADAAATDEPEAEAEQQKQHLADSGAGHVVLRRIIEDDAARLAAGERDVFAHVLIETLAVGSLAQWLASNRACFVLLSLFDLKNASVNQWLHRELSGSLADWHPQHSGGRLLLAKFQPSGQ